LLDAQPVRLAREPKGGPLWAASVVVGRIYERSARICRDAVPSVWPDELEKVVDREVAAAFPLASKVLEKLSARDP
jgi:hypothetical protein